MPGFDDIFGDIDDIVDEKADTADEWDAGGLWDTGEKENIWRTETPRNPGDVWSCGGGCQDCDDECAEPETVTPRPGDPISEGLAGPLNQDGSVAGDQEVPSDAPSEYDEMEEYDNLLDDEDDSDSDGGSFGDILGDW